MKKVVQKFVYVVQCVLHLHSVYIKVTPIAQTKYKKCYKKTSKMESYSFKKGYNQVPTGKAAEFKTELMSALKITSHQAWLRRIRGITVPRVDEVKTIEEVFAKYGISKNIWGE